MKKLITIILLQALLVSLTQGAQLCNPYSQPFPCTSCQPYSSLSGGFCSCV